MTSPDIRAPLQRRMLPHGAMSDAMRDSRPIEANGRFIGVAVAKGQAWQVVPVDPAVASATGSYHSEAEAISAARQALFAPRRG